MNTIQHFEERHKKILNILFFLVLVLGLYLRFYQYLMGRSLWEDEAHLALNFITRDYSELLKPLDYIQAAPPVFLLTVKAFTHGWGNNEYALRALPFLSSILTLPLFYYILLSLTRSKIAALTGFLPFAVNIAVIYYSSELKTYELDVATFLLMTYLSISKHPFVTGRRNLWLGIAGCICLMYSNVAFIILFCVACHVLINWFWNKKINKGELIVLAAWGIVFTAYYFLFIYQHPYAAIQRQNYSFAFPPLPLFGPEFNQFMRSSIHEIGFTLLLYVSASYGFTYILALLLIAAIVHAIYKKQYSLLLFTCLPVLIHFTLSLFKVYPFWYRLILYFVPALIILMASGVFIIVDFITRRINLAAGIIFIFICSFFFTEQSFRQYPLYFREVKPALDIINRDYPHSYVYITTPYTLYKYYNLTGYAKNSLYEGLDWNNNSMSPETYYEAVGSTTSNYILLHAEDMSVDSFQRVIKDLRIRKLIVREFTYKSYVVSEVKPLTDDNTWLNLNYSYFPADKMFVLNGKNVVAVWTGDVSSKPVFLPEGKYKFSIVSKGTAVSGIFPHLNIFVNNIKTGDFTTPVEYSSTDLYFEQKTDGEIIIKILMDNDAEDKIKKEDRNAFIHSIRISKAGK